MLYQRLHPLKLHVCIPPHHGIQSHLDPKIPELLAPRLMATADSILADAPVNMSFLSSNNRAATLVRHFHILRVGFEDDDTLQYWGQRQVLLGRQLRALTSAQQHRRCVGLEARDGLGLSSLHRAQKQESQHTARAAWPA